MVTDPVVGAQSVVYAESSLEELLAELESVGVEHLELWDAHLAPEDGEETIAAAEAALAAAGVSVVGYGVIDLADTGDVEPYAALADRLGADYLTVNYPPDRDDITEELIGVARRRGLDVAIHNYSTVHHDDLDAVFSTVEDVATVLARYPYAELGACVDTGHFLVMGESPGDAIERLSSRLVAVHLKDTSEGEKEDLPGAGALDLDGVVDVLADNDALSVPLVIEYELDPERATDALEEAVENITTALDRKA